MSHSLWKITALLGAIALSAAACSTVLTRFTPTPAPQKTVAAPVPHVAPAVSEKTINVVLVLPLTGSSSALGQAMLQAAQMALFDANIKELSLLPVDSESLSAAALSLAIKERKPDVVLGPVFAKTTSSMAPLAKETPVISFSNHAPLAGNGIFLLGFMPEEQVSRIARYALMHDIHEFYVIAPSNVYGQLVVKHLRDTVVPEGGTVTKAEFYTDPAKDLSLATQNTCNAITNSSEKTVGLLIPEGGEALSQTAALLEKCALPVSRVRFLGTGQWDDPKTLALPFLQGAWFASTTDHQSFEQQFASHYGYTPQRLSSLAYDAVALIGVLTRNGEKISTTSLHNARGFAGMNGIFRFKNNDIAERGLAILQLNPGTIEVIEPSPQNFPE